MKRFAYWALACVVICGCGERSDEGRVDASAKGQPVRVIVVTDAAGLNDQGFNAVCWKGVQDAERDLGASVSFKEPGNPSNYEAYLDAAAANADVVVSLGAMIAQSAAKVAERHPGVKFIQIEGGLDTVPTNLRLVNFRSEQGGYLAGVVAALFTDSNKVGVVGGMMIPPVEAYIAGFEAGVKTVNANTGKDVSVEVLAAGTFADPVRGHELAKQLIANGCDVIFRAAGHTGQGVMKAVEENADICLIGEDLDIDDAIPGRVLTSTLKRMDLAVFQGIRDAHTRTFEGGSLVLDAPDGFMDITDMRHTRAKLDDDAKELLDSARRLLRNGRIHVPAKRDAVKTFEPPQL